MSLVIYNFHTENVLKATIEKVWSILEDARNWPDWSKGFKKIDRLLQVFLPLVLRMQSAALFPTWRKRQV
jgi:hypothetical protein